MAMHLDLDEQEQIDTLKHFWARFGNLITWGLIVILGGYAAWSGYNYWQQKQATQAAVQFEALDRAIESADVANIKLTFNQIKEQSGKTVIAQQAALIAAKALYDKSQTADAIAALQFAADSKAEPGYQAIAKLRLAAFLSESKKYDDAMTLLDGINADAYAHLVQDRKADILSVQGKSDEARAMYEKAYMSMKDDNPYRTIVAYKWRSVGGTPPEVKSSEAEDAQDSISSAAATPTVPNAVSADAEPAKATP